MYFVHLSNELRPAAPCDPGTGSLKRKTDPAVSTVFSDRSFLRDAKVSFISFAARSADGAAGRNLSERACRDKGIRQTRRKNSMNAGNRQTGCRCEDCENYIEDEDTGEYFCTVLDMFDQDEYADLASGVRSCAMFRFRNEYRIVEKQN